MLQLFHQSVAKVDLDVGLSSKEERASAEAMAALAGKLAAMLHKRNHKVTSALAYVARSPTTCGLRCPYQSSGSRNLWPGDAKAGGGE
jgi:hypothetical protein